MKIQNRAMRLFLFTLNFMGLLGFDTAQSLPESLYLTDSLAINITPLGQKIITPKE